MKQVYAKLKDKGVEFVGISLDPAGERQKLINYVKEKKLPWLHAFSGKGSNDPTAARYGIASIPSVWVIDKGGEIFSDNARSDLEGTINRALAAAAKKPSKTKTP